MKNIFVFVLVLLVTVAAQAQEKKAPKSPLVTVSSENVSVVYGQPSKNDREIFGKLVPYGKVWRTGANKATEVTFKKDVVFGGKKVAAGTYSLFTIPNENEWTVILNSELEQFGAFGYEGIKKKNIAEVNVPSKKGTSIEEKMTIKTSDTELSIAWDNVVVKVPLKF